MQLDTKSFPYRVGVIGVVLDRDGRFLVVQMVQYKKNEWRFPGGGVDEGEALQDALLRELREELGTDRFEVLKESEFINQYDWDERAVKARFEKDGRMFRGQRQHQFLVRYTGTDEDIHLDPQELKQIRWVAREELPKLFVFRGQWQQVERVLKEFGI